MRLSDIMSAMDLAVWPQIAMVLFLGAFGTIVVWTFLPRNKIKHGQAAELPLNDEYGENQNGR